MLDDRLRNRHTLSRLLTRYRLILFTKHASPLFIFKAACEGAIQREKVTMADRLFRAYLPQGEPFDESFLEPNHDSRFQPGTGNSVCQRI